MEIDSLNVKQTRANVHMTAQHPVPDEAQTAASKDRLRLWLRLLGVSRAIEATLRERLRQDFETTLPRFDVMAALDRHPEGLKMSQLSAKLRVSNGNVTGLVDRLVEEGHAERRAVEGDRRAFSVALTAEGRARFAEYAAAHEGWVDEMLDSFAPAEAARIGTRLKTLSDQLATRPKNGREGGKSS